MARLLGLHLGKRMGIPAVEQACGTRKGVPGDPHLFRSHAVIDLKEASRKVMERGPSRVMINEDEAVSSKRARCDYGIEPDVIFLRNDGLTLAAPSSLEAAARRQWADAWVGIMRRPDTEFRPWG